MGIYNEEEQAEMNLRSDDAQRRETENRRDETYYICHSCNSTNIMCVEYGWSSEYHYDGISEIRCQDCGKRFGRWTEKELKEGEYEKPYGGK